MNAVDVSAVVDKLAEKLGVAVEQVQPLAEEVVRQYVVREWAFAIGCAILWIALLGLCAIAAQTGLRNGHKEAARDANYTSDETSWYILAAASGIVALIATAICAGHVVYFVSHALAPLPSLLGL